MTEHSFGFFIVPRDQRTINTILPRADQRHVWMTLLRLALWKPEVVPAGGKYIQLGRGDVFASEPDIAREAGTTRQVVRTVLKILKVHGLLLVRLVVKSNPHNRQPNIVYSINNYDKIQSFSSYFPTDPLTDYQPTTNRLLTDYPPDFARPLDLYCAERNKHNKHIKHNKEITQSDTEKSFSTEPLGEHAADGLSVTLGNGAATDTVPLASASVQAPTALRAEPAPPSSVSPPAPKKSPPKAKSEAKNPRYTPLIAKMVAVFRELRKSEYVFQGGRDGRAINQLLAITLDDDEILRRWRKALELGPKSWPGTSTIAHLPGRWNELAELLPVKQRFAAGVDRNGDVIYEDM